MRAVHEYSSNSRFIMDRITLSNNKASHDRVKNYLRTKVRRYVRRMKVPSYLRTFAPSYLRVIQYLRMYLHSYSSLSYEVTFEGILVTRGDLHG